MKKELIRYADSYRRRPQRVFAAGSFGSNGDIKNSFVLYSACVEKVGVQRVVKVLQLFIIDVRRSNESQELAFCRKRRRHV